MSVFFFKQKTAYEMRISDWSSDVCSSDLRGAASCAFGSLLRQQAIDPPRSRHWVLVSREDGGALGLMAWLPDPGDPGSAEVGVRTEERRVGKACVRTCRTGGKPDD